MSEFFDLLGDREGFLAVAYGHDGHYNDRGRFTHKSWVERRYAWPSGRGELLHDLQQMTAANEKFDAYVCPAVRFTDDRRKGSALPPTLLWADLDDAPADTAVWDTLEPTVVSSGTDGHRHAYVRLSRPVDLGTHARLNKALAERLGADHKWSDEALLRLPGTLNRKTDPPHPVRMTTSSARVWDPDELADLLGVNAAGHHPDDNQVVTATVGAEPVEVDALPRFIRDRLTENAPADRSAAFHGLVGACRDAGLSQGQAVTVATSWTPAVEKYGRRIGDEVARSWPKVTPPPDAVPSANRKSEPQGHHGQVRMAYRLADAYADRLMFVHSVGWFAWDGQRWTEDDRGEAKRAVLDVLRTALAESIGDTGLRADVKKCESAAGISGVLDIAAALEPFARTVDDLDADPYLINTASGTLDLRTMELRAHDPGDRITKVCRGSYDPDAPGEAWSTFLERVLPDVDVRGFVARLAGVGLLGKVVEHVLAILTGTGANGKGTFYGALNYAFGDYATVAEPDLFMHRDGAHPTGEMDLMGVRWVVVSESDPDRRLAEATMKRLTGGDEIRARRMRQDFVSFAPSHTAVLVTNHLPKVRGDDPAIWRRIRVVPFDVVIPEEERDGHLDERLQLDADAVLTWAVHGYAEYVRRGGLDAPEAVTVATEKYHADSDAVARFITDCCVVNPIMSAMTAELFERWQRWAHEDGTEPGSKKSFGQALDRKGFVATKGSKGRRPRKGIGLAAELDDEGEK